MNTRKRRFAFLIIFVLAIIAAFALMLASLGNTVSDIALQDKNPFPESMLSGRHFDFPDEGGRIGENRSDNQSHLPPQANAGNGTNTSFVHLPSGRGFSDVLQGSGLLLSASFSGGDSDAGDASDEGTGDNSTDEDAGTPPQDPPADPPQDDPVEGDEQDEEAGDEDAEDGQEGQDAPQSEVPEFGTIAAALVLIGAGVAIHKKRN